MSHPPAIMIGAAIDGGGDSTLPEGEGDAGTGAAQVGAAEAAPGLTEHAVTRMVERGISQSDVQEAIRSAREDGNVSTQTGKYGTLQQVYRGSNGVTAVVETAGKNAGKVITVWK